MAQIACIGWGSLVWEPKALPIRSVWFKDGPVLNVEFLRQSKDGRMTLVIDSFATPVQSLWAKMGATALAQAREDLRSREEIPKSSSEHFIGSWSVGSPCPSGMSDLDAWAQARDVQHVVWTALSAKFGGENRTPVEQEVVEYLRGLTGVAREKAERYIRRAPRQIDTALRRRIVAELNWAPIGDA